MRIMRGHRDLTRKRGSGARREKVDGFSYINAMNTVTHVVPGEGAAAGCVPGMTWVRAGHLGEGRVSG